MKKSKILVATLTAAAIAVGCGAFVGCNKDDNKGGDQNPSAPPASTTTYDVTFNANGGHWAEEATTVKLTTGTDGKLTALPDPAPSRDDYTFASYNTAADGSGTTVTVNYTYSANTTVYAQWTADEEQNPPVVTEEYTITLHVGAGTLAEGAKTSYKTGADGKIVLETDEYLPTPSAVTNWKFKGWSKSETGGALINETTEVFEADTDLYAIYWRNDGVWNSDGSEFVAGLTLNGGASVTQYWLGGSQLALEKDDEISLYIDGALISFFIKTSSSCIDKSVTNKALTKATVTENANFAIYLDHNADKTWSCEFSGISTDIKTVSEIPEGCDAIQITGSNGAVTIYLVDKSGNAVGAADFANFVIYTFSPELFGNWDGSKTNGLVAAEMTGNGAITASTGFIFRWGTNFGTQSGNIFNIEVGNSYLIDLSVADEAILYVAPEA